MNPTEDTPEEQEFIRLLDIFHAAEKGTPARLQAEQELICFVDQRLRLVMPGRLRKEFGATAQSYSNISQEFFVKVIEKRDDAFWRAKTFRDLRNWVSRVMANSLRSHLRRKKTGNRITLEYTASQNGLHTKAEIDGNLEEYWLSLAAHLEQCRRHFSERFSVQYEEALEIIAQWDESNNLKERQMAQVLRLHYIEGLKYSEIAEEMQIAEGQPENLREQAKTQLRCMCKEIA